MVVTNHGIDPVTIYNGTEYNGTEYNGTEYNGTEYNGTDNGTNHGASNGKVAIPEFMQTSLTSEMYGGERYEYYSLGKYIVMAPGVCGGRPTFKYTRLEVGMVLALLATGDTVQDILNNYTSSRICADAIYEAIELARNAFLSITNSHQPLFA